MKNIAFLALGSNMGGRELNIRRAVKAMGNDELTRVVSISSLYETKPYGYLEQDNFINAVIKIETELELEALFSLVKEVESNIGRQERFKWGPREIDIDILFYNSEIRKSEYLTVPHKGIPERDFVLVPLCEIEPDFIHPELNQKITDICKTLKENNIIRKI